MGNGHMGPHSWTDKNIHNTENITFPQLLWQAVNIPRGLLMGSILCLLNMKRFLTTLLNHNFLLFTLIIIVLVFSVKSTLLLWSGPKLRFFIFILTWINPNDFPLSLLARHICFCNVLFIQKNRYLWPFCFHWNSSCEGLPRTFLCRLKWLSLALKAKLISSKYTVCSLLGYLPNV